MPTLYVENVPADLYSALRDRARHHRKSIAAEVLALLEENVVTTAELKTRRKVLRIAQELRSGGAKSRLQFSSSESMQREDRER